MKRLVILFTLLVLAISSSFCLTAGDIAILAVNTDAPKTVTIVALADIPADTSISLTDNAWDATNQLWRTGEGTIVWSHTEIVPAGTVFTLTVNVSPYTSTLGSITTNTSFNLSASGDQILCYEGTTLPTSNTDSIWLYGFSIESFIWANNSNTSDIPTALVNASAAMTTSQTEVDNAYFANGSTAQTLVVVSGTQSELLALFNNASLYYQNNTGPLTIPTYSITVTGGGTPTCATPVIDPAGGYKYASFDATLTCETSGSTIYYTLDGTDPSDTSTEYTAPISITGTTILKARAYADGYDPSVIASATYTFPITVNNIAELRAGTVGSTLYYLSGEAIITFQQASRNQKYIQDATGAILIDDPTGIITTTYNLYDGITGIYGTLYNYNSLLEFIPTLNTGAATSTSNTVTPVQRTLATITSADQCQLIKVDGVTFTTTGDFAASTNYTITDGSKASGVLRTSFAAADYIGTPIPTTPVNITCLVGQYYTTMQLTPRFLDDFEEEALPVELSSFTATISAQNYVTLTWVTQTETGMRGYYVYRAGSSDIASAQVVSPLVPAVNSSQVQTYVFTDSELYDSGTYYYWLQSNDMDGSITYFGPVSVYYNALGDNPTPEIPLATELKGVYPNPFNPTAYIPYSIASESDVSFRIYNSRGQIVKHFELGNKLPGNYRIVWDGTDYKGLPLSNGVYYVRMTAGKEEYSAKAVLLK
jgi:hypothetical protein